MGLNDLIIANNGIIEFRDDAELQNNIDSHNRFLNRLGVFNKVLGIIIPKIFADCVTFVTALIHNRVWSRRVTKLLSNTNQSPENIAKFKAEVLDINAKKITSKCCAVAIRTVIVCAALFTMLCGVGLAMYSALGSAHIIQMYAGCAIAIITPIGFAIATAIKDRKSLAYAVDLLGHAIIAAVGFNFLITHMKPLYHLIPLIGLIFPFGVLKSIPTPTQESGIDRIALKPA